MVRFHDCTAKSDAFMVWFSCVHGERNYFPGLLYECMAKVLISIASAWVHGESDALMVWFHVCMAKAMVSLYSMSFMVEAVAS